MEDKNLEKQIIEDAINFCLEALKIPRKQFWGVKIGMGGGFDMEIHYSRPETPKYLQKIGIIYSLSEVTTQIQVLYGGMSKGEYRALINYERAKEWLDETINKRVETLTDHPKFNEVSFDEIQSKVVIGESVIPIPPNSNQFHLCKTILKSKTKKSHIWNWDEIFENWGESERLKQKNSHLVIYSAAREINDKVAKTSKYKDLFIITTKTTQLNSKFV